MTCHFIDLVMLPVATSCHQFSFQ